MTNFCRSNIGITALIILFWAAWPQWGSHASVRDGGIVKYPATSASPGAVIFSHAIHSTEGAGYACNLCHENIAMAMHVKMIDIRQGRVCGACHDGQTKGPRSRKVAVSFSDCRFCHMPCFDIVIEMNRMDPVLFSHLRHLAVDPAQKSIHRSGLSCGDCHPAPFGRAAKSPIGMEVPHDNGDGCARCHNGQMRKAGIPIAFSATTHCLSCHKS